MVKLDYLCEGIPLNPLPKARQLNPSLGHAPKKIHRLNAEQQELAVRNALKYFPSEYHSTLESEFRDELENYGHIYMFRFIADFPKPMDSITVFDFPAKNIQSACIMLQICNNLSYEVAQFPEELVVYGGNGQCFSNWVSLIGQVNSNLSD